MSLFKHNPGSFMFYYCVLVHTNWFIENASHTWARQKCVHDEALYKSTFTLPVGSPR